MIRPLAGFRRNDAYELFEDVAKVLVVWWVIREARQLRVSLADVWGDIASIPFVFLSLKRKTPFDGDVIGSCYMIGAVVAVSVAFGMRKTGRSA